MAADYKYIESTGTIIPDVETIQQDVQQEYINAFGNDINLDPQSPEGLLISAETLARISVARNNSDLANQINPNLSGGIYFDAIWALTGGYRDPGELTLVAGVTLAGQPGTVIDGLTSLAKTNDSNGFLFQLLNTVIIGPAGTATGTFRAMIPGPLTIDVNTLTIIVNGPIGWETVTNPFAGSPGRLVQSDLAARNQRRKTLGLQGSGFAEAVISALYKTQGVTSLQFRENVTGGVLVIDGVSMLPHSMYACIDGGSNIEVATTITNKKGGGCNYNNGPGTPVSQPYTNPYSFQTINVLFDRPEYITILVQVTIRISNVDGGDPVSAVKQAIIDYANGDIDGEDGLGVGDNVSPFELAGAINIYVPGVFVSKLEIAATTPPFSTDEIPISIWQRAIITEDSISVIQE